MRWTVVSCLVLRGVETAVVVPGPKRWSDAANNQHANLGLRTSTLDRSQRAEAIKAMEDGSEAMEVVESSRDSWGRLLTMSVQDEGSTGRVGSQPGARNGRSWSIRPRTLTRS